MAYADQQMSGNKITALIIVAILHVALGYALVTGLAYEAYKKVKEVTSAVNIEEEKPPETPPPPPPPKDQPPPPIVAPPPPISFNAPAKPCRPRRLRLRCSRLPLRRRRRRRRRRSSSPRALRPRAAPAIGRRRTTILRVHCVKSGKALPASACLSVLTGR